MSQDEVSTSIAYIHVERERTDSREEAPMKARTRADPLPSPWMKFTLIPDRCPLIPKDMLSSQTSDNHMRRELREDMSEFV